MGMPAEKIARRYDEETLRVPRCPRSDKFGAIIEAAKKVFSTKGFYNAKVSEIASEAQVASGTIYLYFKNKEDLLVRMLEEEFRRIAREIRLEIVFVMNPQDKLLRFCMKYLNMTCCDYHLAQIINTEMRQARKFIPEYQERGFEEVLEILVEIIEQGRMVGTFRPDIDPRLAARMIFGFLDEVCMFMVNSDIKVDDEGLSGLLRSMLFRGLLDKEEGKYAALSISRLALRSV